MKTHYLPPVERRWRTACGRVIPGLAPPEYTKYVPYRQIGHASDKRLVDCEQCKRTTIYQESE